MVKNNQQQAQIDNTNRWDDLMKIFQANTDERTFNTWFAPLQLGAYDEQQKLITICVPSKYVYEYIEQCQIKLLMAGVWKVYDPSHKVCYMVRQEAEFAQVVDYLKNDFNTPGKPIHLAIPNARKRLEDGLRYYLGDKYKWLPDYERIADWLTDNKGRGLLCVGTSGLGKTLICQRILPILFGRNVVSVTAQEMNTRIDELLKERCVIIDDLGKEDVEVKNYGNRRKPFFELCDAAEKRGLLLIITTNLSTTPVAEQFRNSYPLSIEERYGDAVISRLRATTRVIIVQGDDMRG